MAGKKKAKKVARKKAVARKPKPKSLNKEVPGTKSQVEELAKVKRQLKKSDKALTEALAENNVLDVDNAELKEALQCERAVSRAVKKSSASVALHELWGTLTTMPNFKKLLVSLPAPLMARVRAQIKQ